MTDDLTSWVDRPLAELIGHIVSAYHEPLPTLFRDAEADVAQLAGTAAIELRAVLDALEDELLQHIAKEESVLFPWVLAGRGRTAVAPIRVMQLEHTDTLNLLQELRASVGRAAAGRTLPAVERLCAAVIAHMRLENEVLFPRALAGG